MPGVFPGSRYAYPGYLSAEGGELIARRSTARAFFPGRGVNALPGLPDCAIQKTPADRSGVNDEDIF